MIILMVTTPPALRSHTLQSPYISRPEIAWFYISGDIYFVYAYPASVLCVGGTPLSRPVASPFLTQLGPRAGALVDSIQRMRQAGVRFIAGTDAGVPGARFDDYVGMPEFFQEIGFTNIEILNMATTHATEALGLSTTVASLPAAHSHVPAPAIAG